MGNGNVSERRMQPPQVGVSVVILALGGQAPDAPLPKGRSGVRAGTPCRSSSRPAPTDGEARSRLWIPLVRRVRQPYLGCWALPGGDLRADRSLERSAYLALASTTDLHPEHLEQLHTFGDLERSRGGLPMVSIVYWALVGPQRTHEPSADNVAWFPEDGLPELAFDHRKIIDHALRRLRERIEYPDLIAKLVGPSFTLRQLHDVAEAVEGRRIDLANFRRGMLASGELEDTGAKRIEGRHRPATVCRYIPGVHGDYAVNLNDITFGAHSSDSGDSGDSGDSSVDAALHPLMTTA